ncbi:VOC family protein [Aeromicrobium sp. Leaf350]|uniref:VOC family protein n=1 Tax=Aeromicrobium sp. Leaf350 TaxID=2876565 RepID=UPI001E323257|nr:VOC family protein [Aeromicrobium sp. Leaf350]
MTPRTHLGQVATVVVPVTDQQRALEFYTEVLGMTKVNDFTYPSGEWWLEVSPAEGSSNLCLVAATTSRPAGVETGIVLSSTSVEQDRRALAERGVDVSDALLPTDQVTTWSGAPLAGFPDQFLLRDNDGNSFLVVAAPTA